MIVPQIINFEAIQLSTTQVNQWGVSSITAHCIALIEQWQNKNFSDNLLVVTSSLQNAQEYYHNLSYLSQHLNLESEVAVNLFQDYELLPYDMLPINKDHISKRLGLYQRLLQHKSGNIVIGAVTTLMHKVLPRNFVSANSFQFCVGQKYDAQTLAQMLQVGGYQQRPIVTQSGQFAVRGAIIDLYPSAKEVPIRLEFFDEQIESIRYFDPFSQRTISQLKQFTLMPAGEFDFSQTGVQCFEKNWFEHIPSASLESMQLKAVKQKRVFDGIENYMPLFFVECKTLLDYFAQPPCLFIDQNCYSSALEFEQNAKRRYGELNEEVAIIEPQQLYLSASKLWELFKKSPRIEVSKKIKNILKTIPQPKEETHIPKQSYIKECLQFSRSLIAAQGEGQLQSLQNMLQNLKLPHTKVDNYFQAVACHETTIIIFEAPFATGFRIKDLQLLCYNQLWQQNKAPILESKKLPQKPKADTIALDMMDMQTGDPIVHIEHGIGLYQGLKTMAHHQPIEEFIVISYQKGETLYVPISDLHHLSKYNVGSSLIPPKISKLGSEKWRRDIDKAKQIITDSASELLESHTNRKLAKGIAMKVATQEYTRFCAEFEYTETEDQLKAIVDVERDMARPRPMNRLVCGDVGFGKTEVAMRGAFIAMNNKKQTVVLVPTTLLANQHYETFSQRFKNSPARITLLTRTQQKQTEQIAKAVADNAIDIIIGTHKLLFSKLCFDNVGLLIIDEEHRFGVKQKEKLKQLNYRVDQLTLTATPIPRTLNMALSDIMHFSIIAQPPQDRLPINTIITSKFKSVVKEAIMREILRGGQIFYLQNKITKMSTTLEYLQNLLPRAKIRIAHGQMHRQELERTMFDFYNHQFDVLLCTTIIETGIDIPNANTIIIEQAEQFGLAQLHQIRGRVGRSFHQAYAYLLTVRDPLTAEAQQRLEALSLANKLGSGFNIASHDLEIRGAGEILGEHQSGQIQRIGMSLYLELLQKAIKDSKNGDEPSSDLSSPAEIKLGLSAILPDNYIPDIVLRIALYRQLNSIANRESLQQFQLQLIDRFGPLPKDTVTLLGTQILKIQCRALGIEKIHCSDKSYRIVFGANTNTAPQKIVHLLQSYAGSFRFEQGNSLIFIGSIKYPTLNRELRIAALDWMLDELQH